MLKTEEEWKLNWNGFFANFIFKSIIRKNILLLAGLYSWHKCFLGKLYKKKDGLLA